MAATAFILYNAAKRELLKGRCDLDTNLTRAYLYKGSSNASTTALILLGSVTNAVSGGGYTGAKSLTSITISLSGDAAKFDAADTVYTASGANITSVKYLVIASTFSGVGNQVVCWSRLSATAFSVTSGNTLTVQYNSAGIFSLT
jgi:hypothetical protein